MPNFTDEELMKIIRSEILSDDCHFRLACDVREARAKMNKYQKALEYIVGDVNCIEEGCIFCAQFIKIARRALNQGRQKYDRICSNRQSAGRRNSRVEKGE